MPKLYDRPWPGVLLHNAWGSDREPTDAEMAAASRTVRRWRLVGLFMVAGLILAGAELAFVVTAAGWWLPPG